VEQLIIYLARALVDHPDQVGLRTSEVEGVRLFELKVAPEDVGKIIGRDGRTVGALRTLLGATAQTQGLKVRLEIQDDRRSPQPEALASAPQGP
jgi:uncharacterized protein